MTRRPQRRALIVVLLLICTAAAGMLAAYRAVPGIFVERLDLPDAATAAAPQQGLETGNADASALAPPPPESRFAVIALRPLFSPDRRPPAQPESAETGAAGDEQPDLLVTGIVAAGPDSVAILEPASPAAAGADTAMVVRVGDEAAGWKVESIEPALVVLVRDGRRIELPLIDEDDPRRAANRRRMPPPGVPQRQRIQEAPPQQIRPGMPLPQAQQPPARQPETSQ